MKKMMVVLMMVLMSVVSFSQKINKEVDEMTDKVTYTFYDSDKKEELIVSSDGKHGFIVIPLIQLTNSKYNVSNLIVQVYSEGFGCVEGGIMVIKFTDGTKVSMDNWKDFNCDATMYFSLTPEIKKSLATKTVEKIMVQNNKYISVTDVPSNKNYFKELFILAK